MAVIYDFEAEKRKIEQEREEEKNKEMISVAELERMKKIARMAAKRIKDASLPWNLETLERVEAEIEAEYEGKNL